MLPVGFFQPTIVPVSWFRPKLPLPRLQLPQHTQAPSAPASIYIPNVHGRCITTALWPGGHAHMRHGSACLHQWALVGTRAVTTHPIPVLQLYRTLVWWFRNACLHCPDTYRVPRRRVRVPAYLFSDYHALRRSVPALLRTFRARFLFLPLWILPQHYLMVCCAVLTFWTLFFVNV